MSREIDYLFRDRVLDRGCFQMPAFSGPIGFVGVPTIAGHAGLAVPVPVAHSASVHGTPPSNVPVPVVSASPPPPPSSPSAPAPGAPGTVASFAGPFATVPLGLPPPPPRVIPLGLQRPTVSTMVSGERINLIGTPAQQAESLRAARELLTPERFVTPARHSEVTIPPPPSSFIPTVPEVTGRIGQIAGGLGGGYIAGQFGGPAFAVGGLELGSQIGKEIGTQIGNIISPQEVPIPQSYQRFIESQNVVTNVVTSSRGTKDEISVPPFSFQPGGFSPLAPLVGEQYCEACDPQARMLRAQTGKLKSEIDREVAQLRQQRIAQQQEQIGQFEQIEQRPAEQRDIPHEIQQKQALLQQIAQELREIEQSQHVQGVRPEALGVPAEQAPLLTSVPATAQLPIPNVSRETSQTVPEKPTTFCVGCATVNDALRFLNGEPSQCSVIPDSLDAYHQEVS